MPMLEESGGRTRRACSVEAVRWRPRARQRYLLRVLVGAIRSAGLPVRRTFDLAVESKGLG
jgi:hypothetical protein